MNKITYTFQVTAYDIDRLLPQTSAALKTMVEEKSRIQYPGLWKFNDRLATGTRRINKSIFCTKIINIICIILGIILFVPGIMNPKELTEALIFGSFAIFIGSARLLYRKLPKKNPYRKSAHLLLKGKDTITPEQKFVVEFSDQGMIASNSSGSIDEIPYSHFKSVIETYDLLLFTYDESVMLLQKQDLISCNMDTFREFVSKNISKNYYKTYEEADDE